MEQKFCMELMQPNCQNIRSCLILMGQAMIGLYGIFRIQAFLNKVLGLVSSGSKDSIRSI